MCRIWAHPIKVIMMGYRQFVKRLFPYIKSHIGKLVFTSLMMVFATVLEASIPEITGQIIDTLFGVERSNESALFYSLILQNLFSLN